MARSSGVATMGTGPSGIWPNRSSHGGLGVAFQGDTGVVVEPVADVGLGEAVGGHGGGVFRPQGQQGFAAGVGVVRSGDGHGPGDDGQDFLSGSAGVVVDVVGRFAADHGNRALVKPVAPLYVERFPGIGFLVFSDAVGVLGGARPGWTCRQRRGARRRCSAGPAAPPGQWWHWPASPGRRRRRSRSAPAFRGWGR